MDRMESEYFNWLCDKVLDGKMNIKYHKLMCHLHNFIFYPLMDMDTNREDDGKQLRYRFGIENDIPRGIILQTLDTVDTCSILELMVALALRCEETIMTDSEYGDRTELWFWNMLVSLGLGSMSDSRYNKRYTNLILTAFNDRRYDSDGKGGLFTIPNIRKDLRKVEIWYQMCWYIDTL